MPADVKRRNGSAASCEPCRRAKTRCDHQKPTCARCRLRAPEVQCWYHPAPLTKLPNVRPVSADQGPNARLPHGSALCQNVIGYTPTISTINESWKTRLPDISVHSQRLYGEHVEIVLEILHQLRSWPLIESTVREYLAISHVPMVPVPLTLQNLSIIGDSQLVAHYRTCSTDNQCDEHLRYAEDVLRSTSAVVKITSSMTVSEFCAVHTGENLRVEYLGLLYSLTARGMLYGANRDNHKHDVLTQDLFRCSNMSLRLARDVTPQPNDAIIWLAHENLQVLKLIEGDTSLGVWRRLGSLSSDILALGIHRESTQSLSRIPHFLAEMRRKLFCTVYQYDKTYATIFDRPPQLPKLYADCKLPLDLTDDQVLADSPASLESARACLTRDGWNVEKVYTSTTWARLGHMLGGFREDMIQHFLGTRTPSSNAKLRDLSSRCREVWDSLPAYLKYTRQIWDTDTPASVCFMLGKIYLSYLHIEFHVRRLLVKSDPREDVALWHVSATMLEVVLQLGNTRDRDAYLPRDLPALMFAHGLPCATVLCAALQEVTREPSQTLPTDLSRATLIRNLSVFIADLESVCGSGNINHKFCVQASKAISRTLDNILNGVMGPAPALTHATSNLGAFAIPTSFLPPLDSPTDLDTAGVPDFSVVDLTNFDIGNFDLEDWNLNIDWAGISEEW